MTNLTKINFHLIQDEDGYPPAAVESVWARLTERPGEYIIDNIPFFISVATIGDTLRAHEEDGRLWFDEVVDKSDNSLVRVVFFERDLVDRVNAEITRMGCSTEYSKQHNLLAISIPGDIKLSSVQAYLQSETDAGNIDFEEPILRQPG